MSEEAEKDSVDNSESPIKYTWNCTVEPLPEGVALDKIHVGDRMKLLCSGDEVELNKKTLKIQSKVSPPISDYTLKISKVNELTLRGGEFEVISYVTGDQPKHALIFTDGNQQVGLTGLKWKVASVLTPTDKEPAPAQPPRGLNVGIHYWLFLGIGIFYAGYLAWRKFKKDQERRNLIQRLSEHKTSLPPFEQFHKEIRQLDRKYTGTQDKDSEYLKTLNETFRLYLVRELLVPATEWPTDWIMGDIRKYRKSVYQEVGRDIRKLLAEFDKALNTSESLKVEDYDQLLKLSFVITEEIWKNAKEKY